MGGCLNTGRDALFRQRNNVMEMHDGPALNMCNVTAIVMAAAAITPAFDGWRNPWGGSWRMQPEDIVYLYLHDERHWNMFRTERKKTSSDVKFIHGQPPGKNGPWPPEQIPQTHQFPLREIFGCGSDFSVTATFGYIFEQITQGVSCILRLKSPGHFVTAVKPDVIKMSIGFKDPAPVPWLQNTEDADGNKWMTAEDFKANIHTDVTRAWRL